MRRLINTKIFPNRIIDIYEKGVMKTCLEINRKNEKTVKFIQLENIFVLISHLWENILPKLLDYH